MGDLSQVFFPSLFKKYESWLSHEEIKKCIVDCKFQEETAEATLHHLVASIGLEVRTRWRRKSASCRAAMLRPKQRSWTSFPSRSV